MSVTAAGAGAAAVDPLAHGGRAAKHFPCLSEQTTAHGAVPPPHFLPRPFSCMSLVLSIKLPYYTKFYFIIIIIVIRNMASQTHNNTMDKEDKSQYPTRREAILNRRVGDPLNYNSYIKVEEVRTVLTYTYTL